MRIAILGTRGIPNQYGGFEQFAEYLAAGLVAKGYEVFVYNSHNHSWQEKMWKGVNIIHCYDPEFKIGTAGQFIYDLNCIRDSRKRKPDLILQLGYTSSSVWGWLFPSAPVILTNMDGLEWKRTKYRPPVKRFLKYAEKLAIKYSNHWVADSKGIQDYLSDTYQVTSDYIPYGAELFNAPDEKCLGKYNLDKYGYDLLIARMEPENSIEIILEGWMLSVKKRKLVVVGSHDTTYGRYLKSKFTHGDLRFAGGIYNQDDLNNLRHFSTIYFHGHTVGGTNPSLLEAMAAGSFICAHRNIFNQAILGDDAEYFETAAEVAQVVNRDIDPGPRNTRIDINREKIQRLYSWPSIIDSYEQLMLSLVSARK